LNLLQELWIADQQLALLQRKLAEAEETEEVTEIDLLQEILDLLKSGSGE